MSQEGTEKLLIDPDQLKRSVPAEMARQLGHELSAAESEALGAAIDAALQQATVPGDQAAAMTKFLSFLSHDLRGGLNGAVLMIEVLKRELGAEQKFAQAVEDLDVVRRSILDTVTTMERFLNAEKLRLRRVQVKPATFGLTDLLDELRRNFAYQLRDRGMEIRIDVEPGLSIHSDRQLLNMALQNLISNAIKYGKRGSVEITATRCDSQQDIACRIAVRDHGPGIAQEKLAELFTPYTRGDTYGQKGSGLGLYIARHAAELLGARLWAESKFGEGATFYLDLSRA